MPSGNRCENGTTVLMRNHIRQEAAEDRSGLTLYRINSILGFDDTVQLQYVHEVGAGQKPKENSKRSSEVNFATPTTSKKFKTRMNTGETLNRLTDLEDERNERDKEFLKTWKSQSESNAAKNNAVIAASQAIGQVAIAIMEKIKRDDTGSSTVKISYIVIGNSPNLF